MGVKGRLAAVAKNLLALSVGLLLTVVLLEGAARLMANALGVSPYMQYDATVGWVATPGTVKRHKDPQLGFDVTYRINAHGHRGTYYDKQRSVGTTRILVLGDSNGFGWGIAEGEHFAAILDRLQGVEVVNLALSGYGTDQQLLRLLRDGLGFQPDIVIVQLTENDFDEIQYAFYNQKPKPQFMLGPGDTLQLSNMPVRSSGDKAAEFYGNSLPLPFREWLGWNSYSYNFLNEKYYGVRRRYSSNRVVNKDRFSAESVALFHRLLREMKLKMDGHGVKGVVVHASTDISALGISRKAVFPVVDVWPAFAEYAQSKGSAPMFGDGIHWNAEGHALVAAKTQKALRELGYLPR